MKKHKGRVIKLPDNVDTDIIIPTQYMTLETIGEMAKYAFSPLRPELSGQLQKGDILLCGSNFGCGSSREQAPEIIGELGIYCIVARSFARIFYRNAINNGLLVIEDSALYDLLEEGARLTIDTQESRFILEDGRVLPFGKIPERLLEMIECGGLVNYYKEKNMSGAR